MIVLTIIYDNSAVDEKLKADWGFAALIQAHGRTLLFDTGGNGQILLDNMRALQIDPKTISDVFISHGHFDHIGGLSHFLNENGDVIVHAPLSFRGVSHARAVKYYDHPQKIYDHFFSSGELDHIEQSLAVETDNGLLLVSGCSHPAMDEILGAFAPFGPIYGIVGGLHGFDQFHLFDEMTLICPAHCTKAVLEIKNRFPQAYVAGGAGRILTIG